MESPPVQVNQTIPKDAEKMPTKHKLSKEPVYIKVDNKSSIMQKVEQNLLEIKQI